MDRIETCVSFLVGKASQSISKRTRAALAPYDITPAQYAVLWVLWKRDGQSAAEIGTRLRIDSATATGLVDRLEGAGLIERRAHPSDRRVHLLFLTPEGRALQAPLEKVMNDLNAAVREELGDGADEAWKALALLGGIGPEGGQSGV